MDQSLTVQGYRGSAARTTAKVTAAVRVSVEPRQDQRHEIDAVVGFFFFINFDLRESV